MTTFSLDPLDPDVCIVPIVGVNSDGSSGPLLGTGFFSGDLPYLVTCAHVLKPWNGAHGIFVRDRPGEIIRAEVIVTSESSDLACLRVDDYKPPRVLPLAREVDIFLNRIVACYDHGSTRMVGDHIDLSPSNRLGNVTRIRNLTREYKAAGDKMLELSFPALRGASGAPVIDYRPPFAVWGVITANTAYEIHPAQVERIVEDDGKVTEETRFYLPQALAIHVNQVQAILDTADKRECT